MIDVLNMIKGDLEKYTQVAGGLDKEFKSRISKIKDKDVQSQFNNIRNDIAKAIASKDVKKLRALQDKIKTITDNAGRSKD